MQNTASQNVSPDVVDDVDVDPIQKFLRCLDRQISARYEPQQTISIPAPYCIEDNASKETSFEALPPLPVPDDFWACPAAFQDQRKENALKTLISPLIAGPMPPSVSRIAAIESSASDDNRTDSMLETSASPLFVDPIPLSESNLIAFESSEIDVDDKSIHEMLTNPLFVESISPLDSGPSAAETSLLSSPTSSSLSSIESERKKPSIGSVAIQTECDSIETNQEVANTSSSVLSEASSSLPPEDRNTPSPDKGKKRQRRPGPEKTPRFKPFHETLWTQRFGELRIFHREHGHCLVPHDYVANPQLARWVKRQRRQHKLMEEGKSSTMTKDRAILLDNMGFAWERHEVAWMEKMQEYREFRAKYGRTSVSRRVEATKSLALWVKCQKRQIRLFKEGKGCSMSAKRIAELEEAGILI